ncbi:MAG: cytochrome c peroxidase [Flavobacteriales bacterium]|nr:cytochrome c peroxidase [Flavobacteriales bacterium]
MKDETTNLKKPGHFPSIEFPEGNEPTKLRIELGRMLFYDNRLSADNSTNCSSCHVLSSAFTDGKKISAGLSSRSGKRNAPTLTNLAWMPYFMMEGGVPTLELQALAPLHDSLEMGFNMMLAIDKLRKDEKLVALARAAYQRDTIDPYVVTRALAAFQRSFISGDSRYDRFTFQDMKNQLNEQEILGMNLFFSDRTNCSTCHSGVFFSDFGFHNIGLYEFYTDNGRERVTYKLEDIGKFKTPTLRNVELTAPYMHDGSIATLEEVVEFYNSGGHPHANRDSLMQPLALNETEKKDIVAFLKSLTDWNFVQNKALLPLEE